MAILGSESLIDLGRLDLDDWIARQKKASLHLAAADVILAILPVTLFFHENPIKLRQNLLDILKIWDDDPVVRDGTLAVGYAIALALTEKLNPLTLIPQIISFLPETSASIPQKLLRIQNLLEQGAGLERVQGEFASKEKLSNAIAIAFYCFLSTSEDFRLAVLRATHNGDVKLQPSTRTSIQSTGAIAGALSGAYNTTAGIPLHWRVWFSQRNTSASEAISFDRILELSDALVAVWSGLYDPVGLQPSNSTQEESASSRVALLSVYAAPRVIRSR
ncbi:MAG: ADP-ribosylglycohydrolase family protein [Nostoc sp. ChiSLP02]|nr:ADP-ribosylglycohydrolase family protein [Nostoc sp. DedSLP05]MDZ8098491.1 ADP-ribosylglycohydrolase family protein [Nostoc sp. DedSLP01]MDZ8189885.1 ADP-ribosylglycohydrolase family protein [Nostoc sp. ChiSLP02]